MDRFWKLLLIMVGIVLADQLTKAAVQNSFYEGESIVVVKNFFNLTYVKNSGVAWGMGRGLDYGVRLILFKILPVLLCFYFFYEIVRSIKSYFLASFHFSLILAGAVGNLIDRISMDYVVDFFDFYYKTSHFPAFNIADSAVSVGGVLLAFDLLFIQPKIEKRHKKKS